MSGFVGTEQAVETGTVMRVVQVRAQAWGAEHDDERRDETVLVSNYLGKLGTVVDVDDRDMPYRLSFSDGSRVPIREMRFHADEVETA